MNFYCISCGKLTEPTTNEPLLNKDSYTFTFECPDCGKFSVTELDKEIAPIILLLNKIGFETLESCSGHFYTSLDKKKPYNGYILFRDADNIRSLLDKILDEESEIIRFNIQEVITKYNQTNILLQFYYEDTELIVVDSVLDSKFQETFLRFRELQEEVFFKLLNTIDEFINKEAEDE